MDHRIVTLLGLIILLTSMCHAQASPDTSTKEDIYTVIEQIGRVMHGSDADQHARFVSPEAIVVSGKTMSHFRDLTERKEREEILHEDASRQMVGITARSNKNEDAIYVILKTVNLQKEDPRYHSLVLYKVPESGWQVFLWHVGL